MRHHSTRSTRLVALTVLLCALFWGSRTALAQRLEEGFDVVVPAAPAGEEITRQSNMWMLEVSLKPLRMIWVDITNPATGKKEPQLIWYLAYKAVPRPLPKQENTDDTTAVNDEDVPPPPMFVPEFTLVTADEGAETVHQDVILPEAQAAIIRRERRVYKNPVEIAGVLPSPTPEGQEPANPLYGIAMWRGIDPATDYFTIYMAGFSSGYQLGTAPDGSTIAQRKTIEQQFWRPGDRFDPNEIEFRRRGAPRWIYRPDQKPITVLSASNADNPPPTP